jgi:hypothetical protein
MLSGKHQAVQALDDAAKPLHEKSLVTQEDYKAFDFLVPKRRLELPRGNPH